MTHIRLASATEDVLTGALHTAWKLRVDQNTKSGAKKHAKPKQVAGRQPRRKKR
jgi:hypothetical protein